jgi:hypothetical protein
VIGLVTGIGLQLAAVSGSPGAGFAAAATALRDLSSEAPARWR